MVEPGQHSGRLHIEGIARDETGPKKPLEVEAKAVDRGERRADLAAELDHPPRVKARRESLQRLTLDPLHEGVGQAEIGIGASAHENGRNRYAAADEGEQRNLLGRLMLVALPITQQHMALALGAEELQLEIGVD